MTRISAVRRLAVKRKGFGAELIEDMKLILAHRLATRDASRRPGGKVKLEQVWPRPIDVKAIRKR